MLKGVYKSNFNFGIEENNKNWEKRIRINLPICNIDISIHDRFRPFGVCQMDVDKNKVVKNRSGHLAVEQANNDSKLRKTSNLNAPPLIENMQRE